MPITKQMHTMGRVLVRALLAAVLAVSMLGLPVVSQGTQRANAAAAYPDGVYQVNASFLQAMSNNGSMADAAFTQPLMLVVEDGSAYLVATMKPVTSTKLGAALTGYLGFLSYYPGYHEQMPPTGQQATPAMVDSWFDVTDSYNVANGTDKALAGQKYPQVVSLKVDPAYPELWIQVYVPIMEGISVGSGSQFARMELDYANMQPVTDEAQANAARAVAERHAQGASAGYEYLRGSIVQASMSLLQADTYTSASLAALKTARDAAEAVYEQRSGDFGSFFQASVALSNAQGALAKKGENNSGSSSGSKGSSGGKKNSGSSSKGKKGGSSSSGKKNGASSSSPSGKKLNFKKLANGTYTVFGEMIKTDRTSQSMSNQAIDHNIRIHVKNGAYTVTMSFSVLHYSGRTGALGKLWYFKTGYRGTGLGSPSGTIARAKVLSYLKASDGKKFADEYGTDYPHEVSFPLIPEAKSNGWVPLQVFVPVMDDISAGTGTQKVYLKLHTSSVVSGKKRAAGTSTGTSARSASGTSATAGGSQGGSGGGDNGTNVSALLGGSTGSGGTGGSDGSDSSSDGGLLLGASTDGGDGSGANGGAGSDSNAGAGANADASSATPQNDNAAVATNEPPLRRYLGLIIGIPALALAAGCAYALFRRRGQIRGMRRARA